MRLLHIRGVCRVVSASFSKWLSEPISKVSKVTHTCYVVGFSLLSFSATLQDMLSFLYFSVNWPFVI